MQRELRNALCIALPPIDICEKTRLPRKEKSKMQESSLLLNLTIPPPTSSCTGMVSHTGPDYGAGQSAAARGANLYGAPTRNRCWTNI